jgi:hypothetical protein
MENIVFNPRRTEQVIGRKGETALPTLSQALPVFLRAALLQIPTLPYLLCSVLQINTLPAKILKSENLKNPE